VSDRFGHGTAEQAQQLAQPMPPASPPEVEAALRAWNKRASLKIAMTPEQMADLLATVSALVDAAVAQERERCAERAYAAAHIDTSDGSDIVSTVREMVAAIRQAPRP
jgi:hypothetical protein